MSVLNVANASPLGRFYLALHAYEAGLLCHCATTYLENVVLTNFDKETSRVIIHGKGCPAHLKLTELINGNVGT